MRSTFDIMSKIKNCNRLISYAAQGVLLQKINAAQQKLIEKISLGKQGFQKKNEYFNQ